MHVLGSYVCEKCDHPLFSSVAKYEHQTPWPAFTNPLRSDSLSKKPETEHQDSSECYALKVLIFLHFILVYITYYELKEEKTVILRDKVLFASKAIINVFF